MQKANSDTNDTCRTPYCLKLLHRKLLERSSRLFLKTKERSFRWRHQRWSNLARSDDRRRNGEGTYSHTWYFHYSREKNRERRSMKVWRKFLRPGKKRKRGNEEISEEDWSTLGVRTIRAAVFPMISRWVSVKFHLSRQFTGSPRTGRSLIFQT